MIQFMSDWNQIGAEGKLESTGITILHRDQFVLASIGRVHIRGRRSGINVYPER